MPTRKNTGKVDRSPPSFVRELRERVTMRRFFAVSIVFLNLALFGCESQDAMDKREVRRHFNLSEETTLLEYDGYPEMVGFGQREGLRIKAVFQLSDTQVENIVKEGDRDGWRKLPIPPEVLAKLPFHNAKNEIPVAAKSGYFLCKTAGSNVLTAGENQTSLCENHPGTLQCSEPIPLEEAKKSNKCQYRFGDQILGVLDLRDNKLYTSIGSIY
jgi:hypothetical protein